MANKTLFSSQRGTPTDTVNLAGGKAYSLADKEALAQYARTGCFGSTYYDSAQNQLNTVIDAMIVISDNESWMDSQYRNDTMAMCCWERLRKRNPKAKCVCIDISPNQTTQMGSRKDILNIGGFSDAVFTVMSSFFNNETASWVEVIDAVEI